MLTNYDQINKQAFAFGMLDELNKLSAEGGMAEMPGVSRRPIKAPAPNNNDNPSKRPAKEKGPASQSC